MSSSPYGPINRSWILKCGLWIGLVIIGSSSAWGFNSHQPFDISADVIDYVDATQTVTAEGHVIVVQDTSTLTADRMIYDRSQNHLFAQGHVVMREGKGFMAGEQLDYDLASQKGQMVAAMGGQSPWLMQAQEWDKQEDYYLGRNTAFTSCDLIDPHYHVRSSRLHLIPDKQFWAWNNIAYVDTVPLFYSPFIYKNLEKQRIVVQFQPGHDDINGNFLKTITTLRITDDVYDKFLFDSYSQQGNGVGNEFDYQNHGKLKGSLFGYYIDAKGNPAAAGAPPGPQYDFRSYHWQKLSPEMTLQSNVNLEQNISFNNQFFPQDINQSATELNNSIAITQQNKRVNQQIVVQELSEPDPADTNPFAPLHIQTASLPQYNFTLYQMPLWNSKASKTPLYSITSSSYSTSVSTLSFSSGTVHPSWPFIQPKQKIGPIMFQMGGTAGEQYERLDGLIHSKANGQFNFSDAIPLSKNWTFTPTITPQLNWQDKFDPLATNNGTLPISTGPITNVIATGQYRGFQTRMGTSEDLRWKATRSVTLDTTYALTDRFAPNGLSLDRSLVDGGIETNQVGWLAIMRPSRFLLVRSLSGYDLRRIADEDPNVYTQRKWTPWDTQITYDPSRYLEYYMEYQLGYYPFHNQLWEVSEQYKGIYKFILQNGILYNRGTPGILTINNTIGYFISSSWRLDLQLNSLVPAPGSGGNIPNNIVNSQIILTRDMHCWQAQFVYRYLANFNKEYSLLFNLKFNVQSDKKIEDKDLESQFYPWRAGIYAP